MLGTLPGQPANPGVQLMLLFGSNGPPTHAAVLRHPPAHLASLGPEGGHEGSAGLSVHRLVTAGAGVGLSSHTAAWCHWAVKHLGSFGFKGGHEGSAGLSVHSSVGTGALSIETVWNVSEASCKLLAPSAKPTTTAPAPAAFVTMPIECAYFVGKLGRCAGGITRSSLVRKPMNHPGLGFVSSRRGTSAPRARCSGEADGHNRLVTKPFAVADYQ